MEIKTELIKLSEIGTHPTQKRIYGETVDVDSEFLASIEQRGLLQPLLLAKFDDRIFNKDDFEKGIKYVAIAGHRRKQALIVLGHQFAPSNIREYDKFEETEADLIVSNLHRVKTNKMKTQETMYLQQISSQNPELLSKMYLEAIERRKLEGKAKILLDDGKELSVTEKIAEIKNTNREYVKHESYLANAEEKKIELLEKDNRGRLNIELEKEIEKEWDEIVDSFNRDEIKPYAAYKQLKALEKRIALEFNALKKKRIGFDREQKAKAKQRTESNKVKNKAIKSKEKASVFKGFERVEPEYFDSDEFKDVIVGTVYYDKVKTDLVVYNGEYLGRIDLGKLLKRLQEEANQ